MKILNVSCGQFAGVLEKKYPADGDFSDGINIIYGANESGKSTMVNLLAKVLFQPVELDKRKHKAFQQECFPTPGQTGIAGDFVDGSISFQGKNGIYTLVKEWSRSKNRTSCTLKMPDGSKISEPTTISRIIEDELSYSEGIFNSIVLPSQKDKEQAIKVLLNIPDKSKENNTAETRQEILSVLQQAFVESGGIAIEELGAKIEGKIANLAGEHWDIEQAVPMRNPQGGRWKNNKGEILSALYALEDAENKRVKIEELEGDIDDSRRKIESIKEKILLAKEEQTKFNKIRDSLTARNTDLKLKANIDKELNKKEEVLKEWPQLESDLCKAKQLISELNNSSFLSKWHKIEKIQGEIYNIQNDINVAGDIKKEDLKAAEDIENEIKKYERMLSGINVAANIKMLDGHKMQVTSIRTGQEIPLENGLLNLTEAALLKIHNVLEMELYPADVNLQDIEQNLNEYKKSLEDILSKYSIDSVVTLKGNYEKCETKGIEKNNKKNELEILLAGKTLEEIGKEIEGIGIPQRELTDIQEDITTLCGNTPINDFVSGKQVLLDKYIQDYISMDLLKEKIGELNNEYEEINSHLNEINQIPQEYQDIDEPVEFSKKLQQNLEDAQTEESNEYIALNGFEKDLSELYCTGIDIVSECEEKRSYFEQCKKELSYWIHIQQVFYNLKETMLNNPASNLLERFTYYLDCISEGGISAEMENSDKIDMALYSHNHRLTIDTLSEGTKDTIALAFRLAVLDNLYKDESGLAIFDDPFTDMDVQRKRDSCKLLKEFAKKHQVIFLTCSEEYADLLGGKQFKIS